MPQPPSGTITFLFTDVEGSTRLWEEHPDSVREALFRHDAIAASIVGEHGGTLVRSRGEGDSLFAVFPIASSAVCAACALQQAFSREAWPGSLDLRVRMAIHTGEASYREGDYYGLDVNRCARIRAIGHGGQVLVSSVTYAIARDLLPPRASLRDCGIHRLKDLGTPEQVFQLCHPELRSDFPPLLSLDSRHNNLPRQLSSFIGRDREISEVKALLGLGRLVTLTGSGGVGKTRLALQTAADILAGIPHGAWLVELAAQSDPASVPLAVATVLGLKEQAGKDLTQLLVEHLVEKRLLLLMDNCEHLLVACASLIHTLLIRCPDLRILATSRESLGLAGERTYRVPSLSAPDVSRQAAPVQTTTLFDSDAAKLFVDRARQVSPRFAFTEQNAVSIATICHRLDGIPLAIELAAVRVKSLSPDEIRNRLDQRFRLLTGGSRMALPRHQTLRSLIDWSYDLLEPAERDLLSRLSVFSGGWSLEAAERICSGNGIEECEALDLLDSLVEKSLVTALESIGPEAPTRYRMLETVRQYAVDRLVESGSAEAWRMRHQKYFLEIAEEAERHLMGPESGAWLSRLDTEHDNLIAALEWAGRGEGNPPDADLRLCAALWLYWDMRGFLRESARRCSAALDRPATTGRTLTRGTVLHGTGVLTRNAGDYPRARALFEEALAVRRELGDRSGEAFTLSGLGVLTMNLGDLPGARALFEEALAIRRELNEPGGEALVLSGLGTLTIHMRDFPAAREYLERALTLSAELGNRGCEAYVLEGLAYLEESENNLAQAQCHLERSLVLNRELGRRLGEGGVLLNLALLALHLGKPREAASRLSEALSVNVEMSYPLGISECIAAAGRIALERGDAAGAARLIAAAEAQREAIGVPLKTDETATHQQALERSAIELGDSPFRAAVEEGRRMTSDQAITTAQTLLEDVADAPGL